MPPDHQDLLAHPGRDAASRPQFDFSASTGSATPAIALAVSRDRPQPGLPRLRLSRPARAADRASQRRRRRATLDAVDHAGHLLRHLRAGAGQIHAAARVRQARRRRSRSGSTRPRPTTPDRLGPSRRRRSAPITADAGWPRASPIPTRRSIRTSLIADVGDPAILFDAPQKSPDGALWTLQTARGSRRRRGLRGGPFN